jgi:putative NADPH-quinone reductase
VKATWSAPHALVVHSHPVPGSLTQAARARAAAGLTSAGANTTEIDAYEPVDVDASRALLAGSRLLVLVYPTWWGGQPAALKSWIDAVLPDDRRDARALVGSLRRIVAVTSHGSGKLMNVLEGEPGRKLVMRGLRLAAPWRCRSTWISLYDVDGCDEAGFTAWLEQVETRCARLVR